MIDVLRCAALAALFCLAAPVAAQQFDRPGLLERAPPQARAEIAAALQHVLIVRHARKADEDCNAIPCPLSERGEAMAARLAAIIGDPALPLAFATATCRAMATAAPAADHVFPHQASDGVEAACPPHEAVTRTRAAAMAHARNAPMRWLLVAEHSNTVCLWAADFAGEAAAQAAGCDETGRLQSSDYGDIFWLYRTGQGQWRLVRLRGVFDVADAG